MTISTILFELDKTGFGNYVLILQASLKLGLAYEYKNNICNSHTLDAILTHTSDVRTEQWIYIFKFHILLPTV